MSGERPVGEYPKSFPTTAIIFASSGSTKNAPTWQPKKSKTLKIKTGLVLNV